MKDGKDEVLESLTLPNEKEIIEYWDRMYNEEYSEYCSDLKETGRTGTIAEFIIKLKNHNKRYQLVLDIGCGNGALSNLLICDPPMIYKGQDISKQAIKIAKLHTRNPLAEFSSDNLIEITKTHKNKHAFAPKGMVDFIVFNESLYLIDMETALNLIKTVLRPNGYILISNFNSEIGLNCSQGIKQFINILHNINIEDKTAEGRSWELILGTFKNE